MPTRKKAATKPAPKPVFNYTQEYQKVRETWPRHTFTTIPAATVEFSPYTRGRALLGGSWFITFEKGTAREMVERYQSAQEVMNRLGLTSLDLSKLAKLVTDAYKHGQAFERKAAAHDRKVAAEVQRKVARMNKGKSSAKRMREVAAKTMREVALDAARRSR